MADKDYQVGYGKPPRHSMFKPGTSGNPSGKRKPRLSLSQRLDRILAEQVSVHEGGKARRLSKEEVFLRQMVNRALAGDKQCSKLLLDYLQRRQEEPQALAASQTDAFLIEELSRMMGEEGEAR